MVASKIVALCALLAASAATARDTEYNKRVATVNDFWKRDSGSGFKAPEDTKAGSSCEVAFGAGYVTCREKSADAIRLCYNPSIGQVCCQNEWGCPSDSYCLTNNLCCPTGSDPAMCAGAYSVGLPTSLTTADSGPPTTAAPAPPPPSTTYTSTVTTSTPVATINSTSAAVAAAGYSCSAPLVVTSDIYIVPVPMSTAGNSTAPVGTATGYTASHPSASASASVTASGKVPVYTGAAARNVQVGVWSGFAALLAVAGAL